MTLLIILQAVTLTLLLVILRKITAKLKLKDSEFYTDYVKGSIILRVYKIEFEYQAIGDIPRDKLLDAGNLTAYHRWALIESDDKNKFRYKRKNAHG